MVLSFRLAQPSAPRPRVIHEDLAHGVRGEPEELRPAVDPQAGIPRQLEVGLVNERRGLERVASALARESPPRDLSQLVVNLGQDRVERVRLVGAQRRSACGVGAARPQAA